MCDELTFTERAKGWVKRDEPSAEQVKSAYVKMQAMLAKTPERASPDTDECIEFLVEAFGDAGGTIDEILAISDSSPASTGASSSSQAAEYTYDSTPLYSTDDVKAPALSAAEKRASFLELKNLLSQKVA